MISVLSQTNQYILQPNLVNMHHETLDWLSSVEWWKQELSFFQRVLDKHSSKNASIAFKKQVSHFQSLIIYYDGEVVDLLRKKLRDHEHRLARMLKELDESDTEYFTEHDGLMEELRSFNNSFNDFKEHFYSFMESASSIK